ncbi:sorting nexin-4-like protein [Lasius niger]|uniref:Sorting nexin-4-like protein n=1 Tax=Lasius niger TaxID=67767 RepID=A0A0J7KWL6_LASNI|nr:sorting nexin-4-like protein [Lasius niger]
MEEVFQNGNYQREANANNMTAVETRKEDCLLDHMEISVVEAEKRANKALNLREFYTVYLIETKIIDPDFKNALTRISSLWRRYTEFELLRAYLEISYPYIVLPPLPEKKVLYAWQKVTTDTFDPDFVDRRRAGLENFLIRVASHPILSRDKHFMGFLQQKDDWRESVKETGYLQIAESKLKALSVAVRLRKPDKRFETIKNYGIELQKSGHYLDSLAATIDTTLEEEELIADQLKEWLFGASALQAVVRRREALQLAKDEAHDALTTAFEQKEKVMQDDKFSCVQGKAGLMSRLFGSVDTEEVRELKILQLEQRIAQHDEAVKQVDEDLKSFSIKAMMDIERFQHQKVVHLKEILAAYCVLQFKLARKGLQAWQHIKGCLESMP